MTRRTRMILIRAAVVVFLLYAVVNVVNLRTQIKSKRDELASLTLRVEEYQKANETLRQEMQRTAIWYVCAAISIWTA